MAIEARRVQNVVGLLALAIFIPLGCKSNKPEVSGFATPEDAANALITAAKAGNQDAVLTIFGPEAKDLLNSGDPVEDQQAVKTFVNRYDTMHRWRKLANGAQTLVVGADNFPFAIPLKQNADGRWAFDTAAGKEEILDRRIGGNEFTAIGLSRAYPDVQAEYASQKHDEVKQYAQKFISDPGKEDGLYWPETPGQPKSPLGPLVAKATAEGYKEDPNHHQPFHGYYFAILTKQGPTAPGGAKDYIVNRKMTGGFGLVAYPAKYGDSGVMTFVVDRDGVVLQKDLGQATEQTASAMTAFDPDSSWTIVE